MPQIFSLLPSLSLVSLLKLISTILGLLFSLLITRYFADSESGVFFFCLTIVAVLSAIFRLGIDNYVLRELPGNKDLVVAKGFGAGLIIVFLFGLVFSVIIVCLNAYFSNKLQVVEERELIYSGVILASPFVACSFLLGTFFQSQKKFVLSGFSQNIGVFGGVLLFSNAFIFASGGTGFEIEQLSYIYLLSSVFVFSFALVHYMRFVNWSVTFDILANASFRSSCSVFWSSSLLSMLIQWSTLLVAGFIIDSDEYAYLSTAQRVASLLGFALIVVNTVMVPKYSVLWRQRRVTEIQHYSRIIFRLCLVVSLIFYLIVFLYSTNIMRVFGESYEAGSALLVVLVAGQLVNVCTGSVGFLLNLSGNERAFRRVLVVTVLVTLPLSILLILFYGALGAAVAISTGMAMQNLYALFVVKKELGILTVG